MPRASTRHSGGDDLCHAWVEASGDASAIRRVGRSHVSDAGIHEQGRGPRISDGGWYLVLGAPRVAGRNASRGSSSRAALPQGLATTQQEGLTSPHKDSPHGLISVLPFPPCGIRW